MDRADDEASWGRRVRLWITAALGHPWLVIAVVSLLVVAAVVAVGVWTDAPFGNVGEWLSGLGTVAALSASLYLLHQGQTDRRRTDVERERRQARLVSYWVGIKTFDSDDYSLADPPDGPCLYIRNVSDQPIYDVVVQPEPFDPDNAQAPIGMWAMVPPGEIREAFWPFWPDMPHDVRPTLNFVDANGVAWHRDAFRLTVLSRKPEALRLVGMDMVTPPMPMKRQRRSSFADPG
jgi:hypothetical protein